MPARVRTKRRSSLAPLVLSVLRPSSFNVRPGEVATIECPSCHTWQRVMGDSTRTIRDHFATDLSGVELAVGEKNRRCESARRVVVFDLTDEQLAKWQQVQDRPVVRDAIPAEARRSARQYYKPLPPAAPAVHHLAEHRRPAPAPSAAERIAQWAKTRQAVTDTDIRRAEPLRGALGPIRGAAVPTDHEDTREQSRALARTRTAQAIRQASPLRAAA